MPTQPSFWYHRYYGIISTCAGSIIETSIGRPGGHLDGEVVTGGVLQGGQRVGPGERAPAHGRGTGAVDQRHLLGGADGALSIDGGVAGPAFGNAGLVDVEECLDLLLGSADLAAIVQVAALTAQHVSAVVSAVAVEYVGLVAGLFVDLAADIVELVQRHVVMDLNAVLVQQILVMNFWAGWSSKRSIKPKMRTRRLSGLMNSFVAVPVIVFVSRKETMHRERHI